MSIRKDILMKKSTSVVLIVIIIGLATLTLTSVLLGLSTNHMSEEEVERASKYKMEYVFIEEQLELKDNPDIKTFTFTAKNPSDRVRLKLSYLNFDHLYTKKDQMLRSYIYKSLVGFSVQMYDGESKQLIFTYEITEINRPSVSTATPSLFLGSGIQVTGMREYKIIVSIPAKKDTEDQYLKPTFIAGIVPYPSL
jgi:hypothetical protein